MNRAQRIQALAAYEALAKALRESLAVDAAAEIEAEGTAPTWRSPGFAVSIATTNPTVAVVDPAAFLAWVAERFPTEVYEVRETRVREAWQQAFLGGVLKRGEPACSDDGEVVPGLEFRAGGEFRSVTVRPDAPTRAQLREVAREYATGVRELPHLVPDELPAPS